MSEATCTSLVTAAVLCVSLRLNDLVIMFRKILIANRGEIAVRIIRACQELDIATVAVYSDADAHALHTRLADEAVRIGPPPPAESYLRSPALIAAAQQTHCDALHPGYGFLAENADFAAAVTGAGLTFIGPHPAAIRLMGSKTAARATMSAAGVPVIPGYQASTAAADLLTAGEQIGFPLLVKASAGGGGKGMRRVQNAAELADALQSARREAASAFGDDRLYLEKLIEDAHHIEFQVLGDQQGNLVHLFERECSIQRRHQKIIEETPSPLLTAELRQRMGEAALAAARAVNYVNAGTVEFLVDETGHFYFLEMNTRLQVEHPITELVTGVDLVKLQIGVAAGEPLPFRQPDLRQRGHAIECRLYAEDPAQNFAPSIGQVHYAIEPIRPGVRVDSGITSGDEVTIHYDPLLAKLCAVDEDRPTAIAKLRQALRDYVLLGSVTTNSLFLQDILTHPAFQQGATANNFVEQHFSAWQPPAETPPDVVLVAAAVAEFLQASNGSAGLPVPTTTGDPYTPWQSLSGFRVGHV